MKYQQSPIDQLREKIETFRTGYNDEATVDAILYSLRAVQDNLKDFNPDNVLPPASSWSGPLYNFIGVLARCLYRVEKEYEEKELR